MNRYFLVIFTAIALCSCHGKEDLPSNGNEAEIRTALKECAKQGFHQDYYPGIRYLRCHDGAVDIQFSGANVIVDGRKE